MVAPPTWQQLYTLLRRGMPSDFEAEQLFCHVTGWHGYDLPRLGSQPAPPGQAERLEALLERRKKGEPLQYLLGEWEFYGLPFRVGEGVLIPRSDTEVLVDAARSFLSGYPRPLLLDLCSGSGAVAVAVARHAPEARVIAVELSPAAFGYLEENIRLNGVAVQAILGDIYHYTPPLRVDIITANPPYIPSADLESLQEEVRREPSAALDGGSDGLDFYRGITRRYAPFLTPEGALCFEVGAGQAEEVAGIMAAQGYRQITTRNDLSGIPRVITGKAPPDAQ